MTDEPSGRPGTPRGGALRRLLGKLSGRTSRTATAGPPGLWAATVGGASLLERMRGAGGLRVDPADDGPGPRDGADLVFAPGALDGIISRHGGGGLDPAAVDLAELTTAVLTAATQGTLTRDQLLALDAAAQTAPTDGPRAVTARLESTLAAGRVSAPATLLLGQWLLRSPHTGPVRLAIAVLGALPELGGHRDDIVVLAGDDDLTHDALGVLLPVLADGDEAEAYRTVFDIALRARGWGRIWAVDVLAGTTDPDQRRWLLTEGFRNEVMWEYSACRVATYADLLGHLRALPAPPGSPSTGPDRQLLDSAADLLGALLACNGQAPGFDSYPQARDATAEFLARVAALPVEQLQARHLSAVVDLVRELSAPETGLEPEFGWDEEAIGRTREAGIRLLRRPVSAEVARRDLRSDDRQNAFEAERVAAALHLDVWDTLLARVHADPADPAAWSSLSTVTGDRALEVGALADRLIDLDGLAEHVPGAGPFGNMGVMLLLQNLLPTRPGLAPALLSAALRSASVAHRHRALGVLEAWPPEQWPPDAVRQLSPLAETDPEPGIRKRAGALLAR